VGIRAKTIGLLALVILALWVVLIGVLNFQGERAAARIEKIEVEQSLERSVATVANDEGQLEAICADWAAWDDTYEFILGRDKTYVSTNLSQAILDNLNVDFIVFADTRGRIRYGVTIDRNASTTSTLNPGLVSYLASDPSFMTLEDPRKVISGIVSLPEGVALVSAGPIVHSDFAGPKAGTFVAGRFLDAPRLQELVHRTLVPIEVFRTDDTSLPADVATARDELLAGAEQIVTPVSRDTVVGYRLIAGVDGKPAAIARITQDRSAMSLARASLVQSGIILSIFGLALLAVLGFTVDVAVLRRLGRLNDDVSAVGAGGDPSARVGVEGSDEITTVARSINEMLQEVESSQSDLAYLASHDSLTRLYNRRRFEIELERELARGAGALLWFDLDHFKEVNDSLGHAAGDELLVGLADLLTGETRGYTFVARLGGDEFGMLIPNADEAEAYATALRLLDQLSSRTYPAAGHEVRISASVGVVIYPEHGNTADELLSRADLAMYHAKDKGRNHATVYTSDEAWRNEMTERIAQAEEIVSALREDRFVLYAQPTRHVDDGVAGPLELLLRMRRSDGVLITPEEIIPTAERIGLIRDVDRWVVRRAIRLLVAEKQAGRTTSVSVNLSGAAFSDVGLLDVFKSEFGESGVDPARVVIEITETTAISDIQRAKSFIQELSKLGCRFALDDFGSGTSSFSYLRHLPVEFLKIHGGLIKSLDGRNDSDAHFVRAIVEMCRGLGILTVAEYVETPEILEYVRDCGIDYAQGFLIGEPRPVEEYLGEA